MSRVETGCRLGLGAVLLALGAGAYSEGPGRAATEGAGPGLVIAASSGPATAEKGTRGQIVREICDPHTGKRWLLMRESGNPGGPGRMVLAGDSRSAEEQGGAQASGAIDSGLTLLRPAIRAGDRVIVEEHTRLVEAYLEAVALGPAAAGSTLSVRLKMGGKVVRAVVLGPGRAAIQAESGVQP